MAARQSRLLVCWAAPSTFWLCVWLYKWAIATSPPPHKITKKFRKRGNGVYHVLFFLFFLNSISNFPLFSFSVCLISRGVVAVAHSIRKLSTCARDCFLCVVRVVSNFMLPVCAGSSSSSAAGENCEIYWQLFFIRVCSVRNARYRTITAGPPFHHHQIKTHQVTNKTKK